MGGMAERDEQFTEVPPVTPGARLRLAREKSGLTLADVAAQTRIAERHLAAIEDDNFSALASRAYAIGFSRNYARALGLDEALIMDGVREELDGLADSETRTVPSFEPGDPARVPSNRVAAVAAIAAVAVILAGFVLWRSYYAPALPLPELTEPVQAPVAAPSVPATSAANQPVTFTALEPGVWVKFTDGSGNQLMQKELAQGESYTVPPEVQDPKLATAWPDALQVSVGGNVQPRLSDKRETLRNVPVSSAAILARGGSPTITPASPAAVSVAPSRPRPVTATKTTSATKTAPVTPTAAAAEPAPQPAAPAPQVEQSSTVSQ